MSHATAQEPGKLPLNGPPQLALRVRHALGRVRRSFRIDVFDVFGRDVAAADRQFTGVPGYAFRWATEQDIAACDAHHTELDERERRLGVARLGFGHLAVLGLAGETAVFSMWVNPRHVNVPGHVKRRLAPHQWFIYKAFTSPEHRGRKLYEAGMSFVLAEMARRGLTQLVGYAHVEKRVSRKGLARLSFASLGRFTTVDFPLWRRTFLGRRLRASFPAAAPRSQALPAA